MSEPVYLIDTNILIEFDKWLPIALNGVFWSKLEEALKAGQWILLDVVVDEIKYNKDLMNWCKKQQGAGLVTKVSDENRARALEISSQYSIIDPATGNSTVDTYIIAYAEERGLTVFTREARRKSTTDRYKVPDVCTELGVNSIFRPLSFLNSIKYKN
ncbi:MAG: DUF4411 family protein [Candidatus Doudnabacteria bacterium]|nr:DUF4411 family protein [Candidatus Doudnabacteria bacterium]